MADILLAESGGGTWLVAGEEYIDDLLMGTLPETVSVAFVAVSGREEMLALWVQHCGEPEFGGNPWMIHPGIVRRLRGAAPEFAVMFAPWSVMPDTAGQRVIQDAVAQAQADAATSVILAEYADPAAQGPAAGLAPLRLQMVEAELARTLEPSRIRHERRDLSAIPPLEAGAGRIDIVIATPPA